MGAPKGNKYALGNNGGQDPFYESPVLFSEKVDEYFETGVRTKTYVVGKGDQAQEITIPVPTITGLALFLGFNSRQSLYDYGKKDEFAYIVKKAQTFIEREYEEMLQTGNVTGAIFALKNMGWKDQNQTDHTTGGQKIQPSLTTFEVVIVPPKTDD